MTSIAAADRARCEAKALRPGTAFDVSFRFAPAAHAQRILALEAFFVSVRSIAHEVSEPAVGLAKLAWWHRETRPDAMRHSQHPVVRALHACNALEGVPEETLERYFAGLAAFMTDAACETGDDLLAGAGRVGGQEARIEAGGGRDEGIETSLAALGEACFVSWLIRNIRSRTCAESWWVPLDLQARHGASRMACVADGDDAALAGLVPALAGLALGRLEQGRAGLGRALPPAMHHLVVRAAVERQFLGRAARARRAVQTLRHLAPGPRAALAAWSTARRLHRGHDRSGPGPGGRR
jgi:phytoene synthase